MAVVFVIYAAVAVLMIASQWKVYTKAGKPGWACLIPIYNLIVLLEIAGKPTWWILLIMFRISTFLLGIGFPTQTHGIFDGSYKPSLLCFFLFDLG